ncbi:hypothetical protein Pan44_47560 [Caulifigura coniformis]|uniref:Uncharacterized protein n=1 Tax=Caulifigura coniformis TaxID=2527983 RepID=A0A517SKP3_9PLAN|nr:hypothetical protein [Caulifigura coniformis]QDT56699.1 hypothetical protein Pan44_47560 [Caulifigura coniformis]
MVDFNRLPKSFRSHLEVDATSVNDAKAMRDRYLPSEELASQAVAALPDVLRHAPDLADTLAMLAVDPRMTKALGGEAGAALILGLACDRLRQERA